jgi:hypothetical protein
MEKVIKINFYLDDGTLKIITEDSVYFINRMARSKTFGEIYDKYPTDKDAKIITGKLHLELNAIYQNEKEKRRWAI